MAGVSRAAASRVFTDIPRVSEEARRSVQRAAGEFGYVPNRAARGQGMPGKSSPATEDRS
jgi:DNA-binding LacI/PurR family transcriptional regulator